MAIPAAFGILALINGAVCYGLYYFAAAAQQKKWEQSDFGNMPDLRKLRFGFVIGWLISLLPAAWFVTGLAAFPAQR